MMRARARLVESRAFGLVGCGFGLVCGCCGVCCGSMGGWPGVLPVLPGAWLLWDGVGVCVACVLGPALRWPAGVCVCAYSLRACCLRWLLPPWEGAGAIPGPVRRGSCGGLVELVPGGSSGGPASGAGCLVWPVMWAGMCA